MSYCTVLLVPPRRRIFSPRTTIPHQAKKSDGENEGMRRTGSLLPPACAILLSLQYRPSSLPIFSTNALLVSNIPRWAAHHHHRRRRRHPSHVERSRHADRRRRVGERYRDMSPHRAVSRRHGSIVDVEDDDAQSIAAPSLLVAHAVGTTRSGEEDDGGNALDRFKNFLIGGNGGKNFCLPCN